MLGMEIYSTPLCILAVLFAPVNCQDVGDQAYIDRFTIQGNTCTPGKQFVVHPLEQMCLICICNDEGNGNVNPGNQPCTRFNCEEYPPLNAEDDPYELTPEILKVLQEA